MENLISKIIWFVPLELNHSSYLYTSIVEFCKNNKTKFHISSKNMNRRGRIIVDGSDLNHSNNYNPKINMVKIEFSGGLSKRIAFDFNDIPNHFGEYALKISDTYYKRSYQPIIVDNLPYKEKIKPMGVPFMVRPDFLYNHWKLKFYYYFFKAFEIFKLDSLFLHRINLYKSKAINHYRGFVKTRKISDFSNYNYSLSNLIFYQKRLFNEKSETVKLLNQQRVEIINLLRNNFEEFFLGGLQKNEISLSNHSHLISNIPGDHYSFLKAMKDCGICIYSNGLEDSLGWTLPEFLSQGKCIVAENLHNTLPKPLINGYHLLYFSNTHELVEICKDLINDKEKRDFLGKNARLYYEKYVCPKVFFQNLIDRKFE